MNATQSTFRAETRYSASYTWAGYALGFAMSGFFDGILLHQILQWHHLLSGVQSARFGDLRVQIMADGLFHAAMYLVAAAGLYMLYRARADLSLPRGGRRLMANFWIGFGVWHVLDAVLSHWVTRIHRIRMDVSNPLAWDLAWLFLFGVIPLLAGWRLRRRRGGRGHGHTGMALGLAGACLLAGALSLLPVRQAGNTVTVVVRPGASGADVLRALDGTGARVVWTDRAGAVWVLSGDGEIDTWRFYRHGALYVATGGGPAGCAAWIVPGPGASPSAIRSASPTET
ncbi:DUF2243 domain-containing protein [Bordetella flabilis]|uniref:DUF2243 domain-containing protein n=1 Tax=Bordetella flabilis TaxID=463014 RepID=A0A193GBC0_9BORD|nr:DUF2243 domain-containing protein [Bordetella flabilis]ANN76574.1 hypothetical protein BAU07_05085 [Bordetella flabilis]